MITLIIISLFIPSFSVFRSGVVTECVGCRSVRVCVRARARVERERERDVKTKEFGG